MTDQDREIYARLTDALLAFSAVVRELREGVRELNSRLAVQDARDSQVPGA